MIFIALLIILPPLWRTPAQTIADDDLDQRNINIARDRLVELKANKASGGISQDQYDEQVAELELALNEDLELAKPLVVHQSQGRWLIYVLMGVVPLLSVGLYGTLGNFQAIDHVIDPTQMAQSDQTDTGMPSPEAINQMVAKLAGKLKAEPNNLEGWMMLGRSYKALELYGESVDAFAHAYQLAGEKAEVMLPYAEVLALANKGSWSGKPQELVMTVLSKESENPTALWFAAMFNAQQGDKKTALTYLKKLETVLPADSPDKQQIHEIIVNTEGQPNSPATEKNTTPNQKAEDSVTVQVSLAEDLRAEANPGDTVFIYAQALSGPKMPLAIIRKRVSELPLSVSLSDADSMMPNMKLSNFKDVRLLARISKSGNAMPQSGDLIGTDEHVNLAISESHKIVINDRVK
jgi:cytochrome c-type biogenesis protein CcmH